MLSNRTCRIFPEFSWPLPAAIASAQNTAITAVIATSHLPVFIPNLQNVYPAKECGCAPWRTRAC